MVAVIAVLPAIAVLGVAAGALANHAIDRVQSESPQPDPGSRCRCRLEPLPSSSAAAAKRGPIAVVGAVVRRGTCARCGQRRAVRALAVELFTAALFVVLTIRLTSVGLAATLPAYLFFAAVGVALAVIDIDCKRLPNFLVLPSYPIIFTLLALASAIQGDWPALLRAAVGAVALFGIYLVLALIYPAGMGFGDVKLAGVIGAVLGYLSFGILFIGAALAFVAAAVVGAGILVSRRGRVGTTIPLGPYMIGAALVSIAAAEPLARAYLQWSGSA